MSLPKYNLYHTLLIALLAICSFIIFFKIGDYPLIDYDEAIYAQVAKESFNGGNQINLHWLGDDGLYKSGNWFEKPPLMIWLIEAGYLVFGVNEGGARFWVGVFSLFTIALTFFYTKTIWGSERAALLSVVAYFLSYHFIYNTSALKLDIPVGFFIFLSLFLFQTLYNKPNNIFWFWISLAIGVMIKSAIALLPLMIIFVYSCVVADFKYLYLKRFWLGFGIFLIIILPWHIQQSVGFGGIFWDEYLSYHMLNRLTRSVEGSGKNIFYYANLFYKQGVIFLTFFLLSMGYFTLNALKKRRSYLFVLIAAVVIVGFFSLASTKMSAYILPLYPYLAIMIAVMINDVLSYIAKFYPRVSAGLFIIGLSFFVAAGLFGQYKNLQARNRTYWQDSKTIGLYLNNHETSLPVYYYSKIMQTRPSIIFYSDRIIYSLTKKDSNMPKSYLVIVDNNRQYSDNKSILTTPTQSIYKIE